MKVAQSKLLQILDIKQITLKSRLLQVVMTQNYCLCVAKTLIIFPDNKAFKLKMARGVAFIQQKLYEYYTVDH